MSTKPSSNPNAPLYPGLEFVTLLDGTDTAPDGTERLTPAGAIGTLAFQPRVGDWSVHFANGAAWIVDTAELVDGSLWRPVRTGNLQAALQRIDHFHNACELSVLDLQLVDDLALLASHAGELAKALQEAAERGGSCSPRQGCEEPPRSVTPAQLRFGAWPALKAGLDAYAK